MESYLLSRRESKSHGMRLAAIALASAVASTTIGFLFGSRWLLPVLNTLFIYPSYVRLVLAGRRRQAVALALLWALFLSQATIAATVAFPERAEAVTLHGAEYATEMFHWVETGQGVESTPSAFIPVHLLDLAVFSALAFLTGGLASLLLGAVLLNYMNFYAGALIVSSAHPVLTTIFVWQPYAVIRVVSYIILATVLAEAFFGLVTRRRPRWSRLKAYALVGLAGVVLDVLIKAAIAPLWSRILKWTSGL